MRGEVPLYIPVPRSGWRTDVPIHELPPDALSDGLNVAIEPDGLLQPRKGMERLTGPDGTPLAPLDGRVMAGLGFVDTTGAAQIVVSSLRKQYALQGGVWADITGPGTSGDKDTPYRLIAFGQFQGKSNIYLIDGAQHDNLQQWAVGNPAFTTVTNTNFNVNALTSLAASDICVVADRLVVIDTDEKGGDAPGRHTQRVRWSAVLDGTNWPIGAWNDLFGIGNLIAIRQASRTSAVIYGSEGGFIMSAVPGSDAGAFVFDRINDVIVPPHCPAAIVERGGRHWYTSQDLNIWVCDGQNARIFSEGIHAGLMQKLAQGETQRPVAVYDKLRERVIFFLTFIADQEAHNAVAWNERLSCWEPPWHFPEAITAAFPVTEMLGPTWDSLPTTFHGAPLDWDHASTLYATWNDIPAEDGLALWTGTDTGFVNRFYAAPVDYPVQPIPYQAVWGLRVLSQNDRLEVNMVEMLLQPLDAQDVVRVQLSGLSTPYDPNPVALLDYTLDENDITTWIKRLDPTVAVSAFRPANYMLFMISGSSAESGPLYAGATLYAFPSKRGDPLLGIQDNTTTP